MSGGFGKGGFCPGGFCPGIYVWGGFCPGGFVLIPLKFSHNFLSDLAVYDAFLQTDPTICHFLLHFPVAHQQISTFQRKTVDSDTQKICMDATKLLIFNLKESYSEDF